uniref:TIAM Rac1 associated GEF 2 n=1 Tax=Scophthalmus maximus TaxID=52904 RepID=A0A8D3ABI0_SCOMX
MGNADSLGSSPVVTPAKPSCQLRFSSGREEAPSARSWWRSSRGGGRSRGRSLPQPSSWHHDHGPQSCSGGGRLTPFGCPESGEGSEGVCGERTSLESGGSPKVLLSKDGSMRVEFANSRVVPVEPQGLTGLPAINTAAVPATEPSLRTSKGSSLSSEGSWYDSPWGGGAESPLDLTPPSSFAPQTPTSSPPPDFSLVSSPAASLDSVYCSHNTLPAFPTAPDAASPSALLDDIIQEEEGAGGGAERYSSLTLPCRRAESVSTAPGNNRKDFLKSRIRRLSDWTGSLSRKKRRIQEPHGSDDVFTHGLDDRGLAWSSNPLHALITPPAVHCGSRGLSQSSDTQRQNIYENFMQELETGCGSAEEEVELGGIEQLDVLFEKEQGVVRRAGWLSFKALITVSKDGKLELVARRKWRRYWVTLKGCTLLFHETYGRSGGAERDLSPRYALLADDGIVQSVPEHPKKEHVFCLSNSYGDVYLFQATNQTDLENWVTAIHSASAALLARRQGKEDTLRLLRCQSRSLLHKIDMDGKMKKMAELQLSVIKEQRNRKAVESQIKQWEQNLEKLNLDLFRLRCYLSSLQGSELPNPKSLLAVASRPSKSMLGRLGVFSVSSFHALVCSRDEVTLRRRCRSVSGGNRRRGLPSSLTELDGRSRRSRDSSHSTSQVTDAGHTWCLFLFTLMMKMRVMMCLLSVCDPQTSNVDRVYSLYRTFPECRAADADVPRNPYGGEAVLQPASPAHLSVCQRLRKVVQELVDTEKSYVQDLVRLFDIYLTPLQTETFLSEAEMEALFGSLPQMLDFQRVFLQTLEEKISLCPNLGRLETPEQFQKLLFSLGGSFLYYADHFKLYSGFCANHIKVQKVLERAKTDGAFKRFLETRNPTNQHSSCLESYLIKPVQRVLKYPLLLRELVSLTDPESPEHTHLTDALRAMEKVASHINEMQKIYEDYGCVFDQLAAEQSGADRQVSDISMGEFLAHSSVVWLNPLPCLGRLRKEPELTLFVFKRAVILVYRENSKLKKRMTSSRSADLDPFRFRWLIPVSAVQVRPANITGLENPCVWELVHGRSEAEGRPETVFQLCSRYSRSVSSGKFLRCLARERVSVGSLRRTRPAAERSAPWRRRQQRRTPHLSEESCRPDGRLVLGETCSEPPLPSHAPAAAAGTRTRLCSLTGDLEAQLQRLNFGEEEVESGRGCGRRAAGKRRSSGGEALDLGRLLERDFSVHSMTSMINEDCFYDAMFGIQTADVPTLQG